MAMKLFESSIFSKGSNLYMEADFCQILDSHLEYLKTHGKIEYRQIPKEYLGQYFGDFYAVLNGLQISPQYHRIVMLVNGYRSQYEYHGEEIQVKIPDISIIDGIESVYSTGRKKIPVQPGQ